MPAVVTPEAAVQSSVATSPSVKDGDPDLRDGTKKEKEPSHPPIEMSGAAAIEQSPRPGQVDVVCLFMVHVTGYFCVSGKLYRIGYLWFAELQVCMYDVR